MSKQNINKLRPFASVQDKAMALADYTAMRRMLNTPDIEAESELDAVLDELEQIEMALTDRANMISTLLH